MRGNSPCVSTDHSHSRTRMRSCREILLDRLRGLLLAEPQTH